MSHVVLADGVRIAQHEQGEGAPAVLSPPWGETHRSFDRLVALLPADLHVIAPDQRGVGESDKPAVGYRPEAAAADVVGLLDALVIRAAGPPRSCFTSQRSAVQAETPTQLSEVFCACGHLESGRFLDLSRHVPSDSGHPELEVACYTPGTKGRPFSTFVQVSMGQSVSTTTCSHFSRIARTRRVRVDGASVKAKALVVFTRRQTNCPGPLLTRATVDSRVWSDGPC